MAATILHSIDVIKAKQRRLEQLELRAATSGSNTPPEVTIEISDLRKDIAAAGPATVAESHDLIFAKLEHIQTEVRRLYWFFPLLLLIVILAVKL